MHKQLSDGVNVTSHEERSGFKLCTQTLQSPSLHRRAWGKGSLLTNKTWWKQQCVTSNTQTWKPVAFSLLSCLHCSLWGSHVWEHSSGPVKKSMWQGMGSACQQPWEWAPLSFQTASRFPATSMETLSQDNLTKPLPNSDPQKMWDNNSRVRCWFGSNLC